MGEVMVLVGNGLNFFIENYIKQRAHEQEIMEKWKSCSRREGKWDDKKLLANIETLRKSMSEYSNLFDILKLECCAQAEGEAMLSRLEEFLNRLGEKNKEIIQEIENQVKEKIQTLFRENGFKDKHLGFLKYDNAKVKFAFAEDKENYFSEKLKRIVAKHVAEADYDVFTTNYDYIPNSIFRERWNVDNVEGVEVHHMHGHFENDKHGNKRHGELICCAPDSKKEKIEKDIRSKRIFKKFKSNLNHAKIIVLFGSSLASDPHILKELNEKSGCNFIIIDIDSEKYIQNNFTDAKAEKKFAFLERNDVYFIETDKSAVHKISVGAEAGKIEIGREDGKIETPEKLLSSLDKTLENIKAKVG